MRVLARRLGAWLFDIVDLEEIDGKDMPGACLLLRGVSALGLFLFGSKVV